GTQMLVFGKSPAAGGKRVLPPRAPRGQEESAFCGGVPPGGRVFFRARAAFPRPVCFLQRSFGLLPLCCSGASRFRHSFVSSGVGRHLLQTGSFPWADHLSHTFEGHPWVARDWLSEIIFALAYERGGWRVVAGVTAGAIALTFTLLFAELARQMRLTAALSIAM